MLLQFAVVRPPRLRLVGLLVLVVAPACQGIMKPSDPGGRPVCAGAGSICTWAGTGDPAFIGEMTPALETALYWPMDVEFAPGPGGLGYILDWQNHRVRRVDADGLVRTVIGTDEIGDGPAPGVGNETVAPGVLGTSVNLNHPTDIQFSADGATLFLAAWHNHKIRAYDVGSRYMDVTCGRGPGYMPPGDGGPASTALLNMPKAIALGSTGDLYVVDTRNFRVRRIAAATGIIDTVVGTGMRGAAGDGGAPLSAQLSFQKGLDQGNGGDNPEPGGAVALDSRGRLYIADTENQRIRRVDLALGTIETVAGDGTIGFGGDGGPATAAQINYPRDIEISPDGRLFIADTDNHRIRAVDLTTGIIDTVVGTGVPDDTGDGGSAREAALHRPFGIGFDGSGDLYIADTFNNKIRRVVQP